MKHPALFFILAILTTSLQAGGLRTVRLPDLPFAFHPITVDGNLDEWTGVERVTYRPFDVSLANSQDPEIQELQKKPSLLKLGLTYDTEAIYCAIDWTGSHRAGNTSATTSDGASTWWKNGDGVELHFLTDQTLHIASWPVAGDQVATMIRTNDQTAWTIADSLGIKCALKTKTGGYTEEIRIPWSVLTKSGKIPESAKVRLACDVVWKNIDSKFIEQLPAAIHHDGHFSYGFLTSSARLYNEDLRGLSEPNDWGDLIFAGDSQPPRIESSQQGTGVTSWALPTCRTKPTINGDLTGWSAPFADMSIEPALVGPRFGGKISIQYDADNLYIAAKIKTSGPSQNLMPESSQAGYGGGDALQIRINNGKKTVNVCGWFDSTQNHPALTCDQGDLANHFLLKLGAEEAFSTNADGLGYAQEIALPWKVLFPDEPAPQMGDHWKMTFQPWWSGLDPRCTFLGSAALEKRGALSIAYNLPADGEVTLGLFDHDQHLLRTILKSDFRSKGTVTDSWDGLDQWGKAVPAGSYTAKGIYHPHISTDYVMSFGNPGNPPWPTPDGKGDWLSDEEAPQAAATDGKWIFLASPGSEKGYSIMALDGTGQRQWGVQEPINPCTVSLAVDGDYLYALYSGPELTDSSRHYSHGGTNARGRAFLICLDKKTGQPRQFSLQSPRLTIATWPYIDNIVGLWNLRNQKSFSPDVYSGQPRYFENDLGEETKAIGLAATNGLLYVAMHDDNKILVFKGDTGAKIDEIPVAKPAGLFALSDHTLLAVSDRQVIHIDPASKQVQTVISNGLLAPRCVTADSKGQIFVSDWGASFQVKAFSPDGSFLNAIGKEGGRPWLGKWDPTGMILPTGIAVTDEGKLWVAEDDSSPMRISVWETKGALVKEYLGPTPYGGGGGLIDPKDSTIAYGLGLRLKLDYSAKTWAPLATIDRRMDLAQPFARNGNSWALGGHIVYHNGNEYLVFNDTAGIVISQRKGDLFVPVAAMGGLSVDGRTVDGSQWSIWDSDLGYRMVDNYFPPFFKGHGGDNFTWVDANNDGLVQENEMHWYKTAHRSEALNGRQPEALAGWGFSLGDDWSIYWSGFCKDSGIVYRLDLKGWTSDGAPIYDINDSKPIVARDQSWIPLSLYGAHDGKVVVSYGYEWGPPKNTVECFDREGKSLWALALPKEQGPKDIQCDSVLTELNAPGIGNVLAGWAWHGNYLPYLFTTDGLYVSSLLENGRLGPNAEWDESFKAYFQDKHGVPYIINGANDTHHIMKINGLAGGRFEAPVTITQDDVDRAAKMREVPEEKQVPQPIMKLSWDKDSPKIDGNLGDWNLGTGVTLNGDNGRTAQIALARDATNLYLAYEVEKDNPLANKGSDWQTLFISGDCVDLMLGTNPKADPHRTSAVEGDERLLISLYQGKPIAVLYRPTVSGTASPVQLMAARIDQITRLDSARIAYHTKGNSYTIEAAVPLKDLGIDPEEKGVLQGDVGVIFADGTGSNRAQRLYFYNKKTQMTADLTTEATLQPGEWGQIQFPLGQNLLKNSSFEDGFTPIPGSGWFPRERGGARAEMSVDSPRSGHHSLSLKQVDPVWFPPAAFSNPDFGAFIRSADGGAGPGVVDVEQMAPVVGGHDYTLRVNYRTLNMHPAKANPGPDRGYSRFLIELGWINGADRNKRLGTVTVLDEKYNSPDWKQVTNTEFNHWSVFQPYHAPANATQAIVNLQLLTQAANNLPQAFVDDVELIDTPRN